MATEVRNYQAKKFPDGHRVVIVEQQVIVEVLPSTYPRWRDAQRAANRLWELDFKDATAEADVIIQKQVDEFMAAKAAQPPKKKWWKK